MAVSEGALEHEADSEAADDVQGEDPFSQDAPIVASDEDFARLGIVRDADLVYERSRQDGTFDRSMVLAEREVTCDEDAGETCDFVGQEAGVVLHAEVPAQVLGALGGRVEDLFETVTPDVLSNALQRPVGMVDSMRVNEDGSVTYQQEILWDEDGTAEDLSTESGASRRARDEESWSLFEEAFLTLAAEGPDPVNVFVSLSDPSLMAITQRDWPLGDGISRTGFVEWMRTENEQRQLLRRQAGESLASRLAGCDYVSDSVGGGIVLTCNPEYAGSAAAEILSLQSAPDAGVSAVWVIPRGDYGPTAMTGTNLRHLDATRMDLLLDAPVPHTGHTGYNGLRPLRVGVIDVHFGELHTHPAYRTPSGLQRVFARWWCTASWCTQGADPGPVGGGHGSQVTSAFQSILAGQHSSEAPAFSQGASDRSYGAFDAELYLCHVEGFVGASNAAAAAQCLSLLSLQGLGGAPAVDVVNMSLGRNWGCPEFRGDPVWNNALDFSVGNNVLFVTAAGNTIHRCKSDAFHGHAVCAVNGMASRSDGVLVVGGIGPDECGDPTGTLVSPSDYGMLPIMGSYQVQYGPASPAPAGSHCANNHANAVQRCPSWSTPFQNACPTTAGGFSPLWLSMGGGNSYYHPHARTVVDVVAPTWRTLAAGYIEQQLQWIGYGLVGENGCETSFSAPVVAAAAASVRDWGYNRPSSLYLLPRVIQTMMLVNTDLTGAPSLNLPYQWPPPAVPSSSAPSPGFLDLMGVVTGFNPYWGGGRLRVERMNGANRTMNEWRIGSFLLTSTNQVRSFRMVTQPIPSGMARLGAVVSMDEPHIDPVNDPGTGAGDFYLRVVSYNPPSSGGCPIDSSSLTGRQVHATDASYDTKKRVILYGSPLSNVVGRCPYIEVGFYAYPGASRQFAFTTFRSDQH